MRFSKQREEILEYLKSVNTHPTAEDVYFEIRKIDSNISLGTVYRNLDKLTKENLILRIEVANGKDRFDGDISQHYHAICQKCGNIIDIFIDYFSDINKIVEKKIDCKVFSHNIIFNTICQNCYKN